MPSRIAPIERTAVEPEKRRAFREADIWTRFREQEGRCALCPVLIQYPGGKPSVLGAVMFHADHILPRDLNGKTVLANLQLICVPCHSAKTTQRDRPMIDKARRIRTKPVAKPKRPINSPGFDKSKTRGFDGKVRER
jgi:5-methylcytosine-specific restriction endonuclease McrA